MPVRPDTSGFFALRPRCDHATAGQASGSAGSKGRWVVRHAQKAHGMITESAQPQKTTHEADRSGLA